MTNSVTTKNGGSNVRQNRKESVMTNVNLEELKSQIREEIKTEQELKNKQELNNQFQLLKAMAFRRYALAKDKSNFVMESKKYFKQFVRNWYQDNGAFNIEVETKYEDDGSAKYVYTITGFNPAAIGKSKSGKEFAIFAPPMPDFAKATV